MSPTIGPSGTVVASILWLCGIAPQMCPDEGAGGGKSTQVTDEGIRQVEEHLRSLDALSDPPNAAMIERLRSGYRDPQDIAFYVHELREKELMGQGMDWEEAHTQALREEGIDRNEPGNERYTYHPTVIDRFREYFNPAAYPESSR